MQKVLHKNCIFLQKILQNILQKNSEGENFVQKSVKTTEIHAQKYAIFCAVIFA